MFVRAVRFTDVTRERMDALKARVEESGGPPEGVKTTALQLLYDERAGTALALQYFETAEDMESGARIMEAMDASETPGTRVSVDAGEMTVDVKA